MNDRDGTEEPSTQRKRIAVAVGPSSLSSLFFPWPTCMRWIREAEAENKIC